ncbi:MAG: MGH1-like glycoside hydrolase domain-containing protein [bacterium]
MGKEYLRLQEAREQNVCWKKWGPYLSERQWGTVREDYSEGGNAWDYFTHDQARSRAYRRGEDGIAGISDDKQQLCFALALWNGKDPIIKERLFGLTNSEGNHGEDVKEYYFYLDSTPTHSYMKYLYKYPQAAYPYDNLVATNQQRNREELEYELLDTGVFDQDRYFDVFVEYAKDSPEDILIKITIHNRGPETAMLHVLPTLWFRNTWSWHENAVKPVMKQTGARQGLEPGQDFSVIEASHPELGARYFYAEGSTPLLFTENETNTGRIFGVANRTPYVKDGINNYIVHNRQGAVNPEKTGTKAAAHYQITIGAGHSETIRLRLSNIASSGNPFGGLFDEIFKTRQQEGEEFYQAITPASFNDDQRNMFRQALAGMLWGKQYYNYDIEEWLAERGSDPLSPRKRPASRNDQWFHMVNADVISMPDKWEYPWYAAWDLAFHIHPFLLMDSDFGKQQLDLMLREHYLHPNGQIPAYEWNFGDVNPPVHAWATIATYAHDQLHRGESDGTFLKHAFQKLLLNFTWWVNRKDLTGKNVFQGGFLGLDNIGVFDRSAPLPTGGHLEQADGTAWMAMYSQNMLEIALALSLHDPVYAEMALKFFEHFIWIASAMDRVGEHQDEMWDEHDGFFYDVLRLPDGSAQRLKVRSMVGLLPLCATTVLLPEVLEKIPEIRARARWFIEKRPELVANMHYPAQPGYGDRRLLAILDEKKLRRVLAAMLDENEFLSPYGLRSLSRYHAQHPFVFHTGGQEHRVAYLPAESNNGMFGGNSNWRGPIWMPMNALIIRALLNFYVYYGNDFKVECPTRSGKQMTLYQVAEEITRRLAGIFLRQNGHRPVYGGSAKFQNDPHWRDHVLFYEYFHGDNGAGLGASHQTGWTGVVAGLMHLFASVNSEQVLASGRRSIFEARKPKAQNI